MREDNNEHSQRKAKAKRRVEDGVEFCKPCAANTLKEAHQPEVSDGSEQEQSGENEAKDFQDSQ